MRRRTQAAIIHFVVLAIGLSLATGTALAAQTFPSQVIAIIKTSRMNTSQASRIQISETRPQVLKFEYCNGLDCRPIGGGKEVRAEDLANALRADPFFQSSFGSRLKYSFKESQKIALLVALSQVVPLLVIGSFIPGPEYWEVGLGFVAACYGVINAIAIPIGMKEAPRCGPLQKMIEGFAQQTSPSYIELRVSGRVMSAMTAKLHEILRRTPPAPAH